MSAARRKGTAFESAIVTWLQSQGWKHAERRALSGKNDRGDIAGLPGVVIEAKAASRVDLSGWLTEALTERDNDRAAIGVVWAKRRGKTSPADAYVLMDGATFSLLLHHYYLAKEED